MTASAPSGGARAAGYRLFGRFFDYILHLRPFEWPIMAGHTALGALLASTVVPDGVPVPWTRALVGIGLWVVCLNGGTLAINSAFDRDESDVAYLRRPPPPPRHLFAWGLGLMLSGLALALLLLSLGFAAAYAVCLVLSVLYSVPPWRLKAVAGADWVINLVGFGAITPLAGWLALGARPTTWAWLLVAGFGALFACLYPLTQLYQIQADEIRGDRTLARRLGIATSLRVAVVATFLAFALFGAAGAVAGWPILGWRWLALAGALVAWLAVLVPWAAGGRSWVPERHQRGMYFALLAWGVTDLAIAACWLL
ncbi:MAG TPA: UbiA family prenyltransferase [Gemmatimonadales bacterium]|nr:UbiA family prenyltransferase [Gemmatimonadales bacterium]